MTMNSSTGRSPARNGELAGLYKLWSRNTTLFPQPSGDGVGGGRLIAPRCALTGSGGPQRCSRIRQVEA